MDIKNGRIAFDVDEYVYLTVIEGTLLGIFSIDIILRFFHEYKDSGTQEIVDDYRDIAVHYLK